MTPSKKAASPPALQLILIIRTAMHPENSTHPKASQAGQDPNKDA